MAQNKSELERMLELFYIADDGTRIPLLKYLPEVLRQTRTPIGLLSGEELRKAERLAFQELKQRNEFFGVMDGAEVQGSINEMIGQVDVESVRLLHVPAGLAEKIGFYKSNASFVTVYGSHKMCFVASRKLGDCVYVRGLDNSGRLLDDQAKFGFGSSGRMIRTTPDYYISLGGDSLDLPIEKEGKPMHPKVRKQVVALVLGSKLVEAVGKPYRKFASKGPWEYDTMSPARLLDLSASDSEVIGQIKEALYVRPRA
jgi:hypothetical protein